MCRRAKGVNVDVLKFEVKVEPLASWSDGTYVGNLMMQVLSSLGEDSKSFKVIEVKLQEDQDKGQPGSNVP